MPASSQQWPTQGGVLLRWLLLALVVLAWLALGPSPVDQRHVSLIRHGDWLTAEGRYSEALLAYEDAARRTPGSPSARARQGSVYVTQGRYGEAWKAYLDAVQVSGMSDSLAEGLARLCVGQGSPQRAVVDLKRVLARRPERSDLWAELGAAYLQAGDRERGREALHQALSLGLDAAQTQRTHLLFAESCLEDDLVCSLDQWVHAAAGPDAALALRASRLQVAVREVVESSDAPAFSHAKLGEALLRDGDLSGARHEFQHAVDLSPDYVDGHVYLGYALSLLREGEAALQHLQRARELDPSHPLPSYFLGMHHLREGWVYTGRQHLVAAYELDPGNAAICAAIADSYLRAPQPEYALAERWLRVAVDLAPDDVRFHLLLAHFYVDSMVDPAVRGIAVSETAVSLAPASGEAHETLGWAYHLSGQPDLALPELLLARQTSGIDPLLDYRLGEVYRALGSAGQARAAYQQAIDLDWNGPVGERARQALAEMGLTLP